MSEHWEAYDDDIVSIRDAETGEPVCTDVTPQHAALIAAAPELYRTLKDLVYLRDAGVTQGECFEASIEKARAAIAKAEVTS